MFKILRIIASTSVLALLAAGAAQAEPIVWTISGPGTTSAVVNGSHDQTLSYNINPAGFNTRTWTVSGIAPKAGNFHILWDYSGFHAFFRVTAFLRTLSGVSLVNAGPNNCCTSPSAGFSYSSGMVAYTFANVSAGQVIGFQMGGSNFDSNNVLRGSLRLRQVPEPMPLALLGLGLAGIGFARRIKKI